MLVVDSLDVVDTVKHLLGGHIQLDGNCVQKPGVC